MLIWSHGTGRKHPFPWFYTLFLVPKSNGIKYSINSWSLRHSIWSSTLFSTKSAVIQCEWVMKTDLTDAYHHITVYPVISKYFRFSVKSEVFQFISSLQHAWLACLQFQWEFSKSIAPVVQKLHELCTNVCLPGCLAPPGRFPRTSQWTGISRSGFPVWTGMNSGEESVLTISQKDEILGLTFDLQKGWISYLPS